MIILHIYIYIYIYISALFWVRILSGSGLLGFSITNGPGPKSVPVAGWPPSGPVVWYKFWLTNYTNAIRFIERRQSFQGWLRRPELIAGVICRGSETQVAKKTRLALEDYANGFKMGPRVWYLCYLGIYFMISFHICWGLCSTSLWTVVGWTSISYS